MIGASGSGKIYAFKPLLEITPNSSGTIEVHESAQVRDLREIAEQDMHASLGLLAQDSHLLHDSLREKCSPVRSVGAGCADSQGL